jgi:hypothetical protein
VATNGINQRAHAIAELNTIVKICESRRIHEGHHFISMAMEVHGTPGHDMDHFIKESACLFYNKQSRYHLSLYFCIQFFKQHVSIALQHALTSAMEKKIALVGDACYRPPIKYYNLHANDIRGVVGEIASYHKRD